MKKDVSGIGILLETSLNSVVSVRIQCSFNCGNSSFRSCGVNGAAQIQRVLPRDSATETSSFCRENYTESHWKLHILACIPFGFRN